MHEKETLLLGRSLIDRYQASSLGNTCSLIGREYTLELRPGNVDEEPLLISLEKNTWTLNIGDGNENILINNSLPWEEFTYIRNSMPKKISNQRFHVNQF